MSSVIQARTRRPYFLFGAAAIPLVWGALIVITMVGGAGFPDHSGGNIGNYNIGPGIAVLIFAGGGSVLLGLILTTISLVRREELRSIGLACLLFYLLPIMWSLSHYLQFLRSRYLYQQYKQAQHSPASP